MADREGDPLAFSRKGKLGGVKCLLEGTGGSLSQYF